MTGELIEDDTCITLGADPAAGEAAIKEMLKRILPEWKHVAADSIQVEAWGTAAATAQGATSPDLHVPSPLRLHPCAAHTHQRWHLKPPGQGHADSQQ